MRESTITKRDRRPSLPHAAVPVALEETMRLYHAWLGYLLTRDRVEVLRVKASDIAAARDSYTCTVTREGDEYVIRLDRGEGG